MLLPMKANGPEIKDTKIKPTVLNTSRKLNTRLLPYHLLTESEVITGKSQIKALIY